MHSNRPTVAYVLTNYRRSWNLPRIIEECLASRYDGEVIIIDNSGAGEMAALLSKFYKNNITLHDMNGNRGAGYRFYLSAELDNDAVICMDDDIFLTSDQIDQLTDRVIEYPLQMHGIWGQTVIWRDEKHWLSGGITRVTTELDILNRIYGFTPLYAKNALSFAKDVGIYDWSTMGPVDDIVMSLSGKYRPLCHDFGFIAECPTSNTEGIAEWRRQGFHKTRSDIVNSILNGHTK